MKHVVIAGGSGLIGTALTEALVARGDRVTILSRSNRPPRENVSNALWDGKTVGLWFQRLLGADAVVNLAGDPIFQSWRGDGFERIRNSRIESTKAIAQAIAACSQPPAYWLNGSAVGYYGDRGDDELTEDAVPGPATDAIAKLVAEWEAAAASPIPVGRIRTGIVLSRAGGSLPTFLLAARSWIAGGHVGSGRQFVPWIHVDDQIAMMIRAIDERWQGPFNATAPNPVPAARFMEAVRRSVSKPWAPPEPAFVVRALQAITGYPLTLALGGQNAKPSRALEWGFRFKFEEVEPAIAAESAK